MSVHWPHHRVLKIHDGCGGLVRWVEAIDTPGVGFTGECVSCYDTDLPKERIVPVEAPAGTDERASVLAMCEPERRQYLRWDDDEDWETNQARLRAKVEADQ
jgi:hypothetical protein